VGGVRAVLVEPLDGAGEAMRVAGSTNSAASPSTSGSAVARVATTGVPQAIASSGGRPKPS